VTNGVHFSFAVISSISVFARDSRGPVFAFVLLPPRRRPALLPGGPSGERRRRPGGGGTCLSSFVKMRPAKERPVQETVTVPVHGLLHLRVLFCAWHLSQETDAIYASGSSFTSSSKWSSCCSVKGVSFLLLVGLCEERGSATREKTSPRLQSKPRLYVLVGLLHPRPRCRQVVSRRTEMEVVSLPVRKSRAMQRDPLETRYGSPRRNALETPLRSVFHWILVRFARRRSVERMLLACLSFVKMRLAKTPGTGSWDCTVHGLLHLAFS
jgi:hypothetical protein